MSSQEVVTVTAEEFQKAVSALNTLTETVRTIRDKEAALDAIREQMQEATKSLRAEAKPIRDSLKAVRAALYQAVA